MHATQSLVRVPLKRASCSFAPTTFWLLLFAFLLGLAPTSARAGSYVPHYSGGIGEGNSGARPYYLHEGWWKGFGNSGSSFRQNAFGSCTGQISTRFTWEPDYEGDTSSPPQSVLVVEEAFAAASGSAQGTAMMAWAAAASV